MMRSRRGGPYSARDPEKRITLVEMLSDEWLTNGGESPLTTWDRVGVIRVNESDLRDAVQTMEASTKLMGEDTRREERVLAAGEVLTRQGEVATEAFFVQEVRQSVLRRRSAAGRGLP